MVKDDRERNILKKKKNDLKCAAVKLRRVMENNRRIIENSKSILNRGDPLAMDRERLYGLELVDESNVFKDMSQLSGSLFKYF